MKLQYKLAGAAIAALCGFSSAQAQFAKPEDAVEYRRAALTVLETHFKRIGAVAKGDKPYDKASVEADAAIVEMMSHLPWSAFPEGSVVGDSRAKPEIWKSPDKFKADADKLEAEVQKLSAAAKAGDLSALKTAYGATSKTCKACHEDFKNRGH